MSRKCVRQPTVKLLFSLQLFPVSHPRIKVSLEYTYTLCIMPRCFSIKGRSNKTKEIFIYISFTIKQPIVADKIRRNRIASLLNLTSVLEKIAENRDTF